MNTIEEFERVRAEHSSRTFRVEIPDHLAMGIVEHHPKHRRALATNKTISEPVIRALAVDEDSNVRGEIARKRATPPDVLVKLAQDPSEHVRIVTCRNPKVPRTALEILASDAVDWVREAAQERLHSKER